MDLLEEFVVDSKFVRADAPLGVVPGGGNVVAKGNTVRPSELARARKKGASVVQIASPPMRALGPNYTVPIRRRGSRVYNGGRCATCVPSVTRTSRWIGRCGARTGQSRGRSAGRERPRVCIEGSARFSLRNSQVKIPIGALRTVILESFRRTNSCFRCGPLIAPARAATVKVECLL
mgnify:CR=1 FL=1